MGRTGRLRYRNEGDDEDDDDDGLREEVRYDDRGATAAATRTVSCGAIESDSLVLCVVALCVVYL